MRSIKPVLLASALLLALPLHAQAPQPARAVTSAADYTDVEVAGRALGTGQFNELFSNFDATLAAEVPADKLKALMDQIIAQMGPFKSATRLSKPANKAEQVARMQFQNGTLLVLMSVDDAGKIHGLRLVPDEEKVAPPTPLAATDTIREEQVTFAAPNAPQLVGTLTLPKNVKNPPAVVLIHGSGPHDRYETMFTNRPFLDLSRGLARQGIAVLAYDKRTLTHAKSIDMSTLTIDQESTDDGGAAAKFLQSNKNINGKNVFVLGHSQGGMVVPSVLQRDSKIRGGIIFASPSGKLIDVLPHQNRTMLGDAVNSDAGKAQLKMIDDGIRTIRDPKADSKAVVFGLPVSYWKSVDVVAPQQIATKIKQPLLVVQGGKDFQVIEQDWNGWQKYARSAPTQVIFKLYPELNHLGLVSAGKVGMEDYKDPRHVDPQLIKDIAAWVKKTAAAK